MLLESCREPSSQCSAPVHPPLGFSRSRFSLKWSQEAGSPPELSVHGLNGRALPVLTAPSREVTLSCLGGGVARAGMCLARI